MKSTTYILLTVSSLALLNVELSAQLPPGVSDVLTITSTTPDAPFVGTWTFPEFHEGSGITTSAGAQPLPFRSTSINTIGATLIPDAGLTILLESGNTFNFTLGANLTFADLSNADLLAQLGYRFSDVSDIVGIVNNVTTVRPGVVPITINTVEFGVLLDDEEEPGSLAAPGFGFIVFALPPTTPVHVFTEGDPAANAAITAALNVPGGPAYSATFVSDVELTTVPETGATVFLLGVGLIGIGFVYRKLQVTMMLAAEQTRARMIEGKQPNP